jgi:diacylglycerol kinase (ATP)
LASQRYGVQALAAKILSAFVFACHGLRSAFASEVALRLEVAVAVVALPLALWLGQSGVERALLIGSVLGVILAELVNTGLEEVCNRISTDIHPQTKKIKDIGAAIVLLSLLTSAAVWVLVLWR